MSTQKITYPIVDGPNRNDLVIVFLYSKDKNDVSREVATFKLLLPSGKEKEVSFKISEIAHKDNEGYVFTFKGYCYYYKPSALSIKVDGYYDAKTRKGSITSIGTVRIPDHITCP